MKEVIFDVNKEQFSTIKHYFSGFIFHRKIGNKYQVKTSNKKIIESIKRIINENYNMHNH